MFTNIDSWIFYLAALLFIILAVYIIKKVASCMVKTVVCLVLLAALAVFLFLVKGEG